jgi:hypothetical protein
VSSGCAARRGLSLIVAWMIILQSGPRSIKLAKLFEMVVDFDPRGGDWQATQIMRLLARLKLR